MCFLSSPEQFCLCRVAWQFLLLCEFDAADILANLDARFFCMALTLGCLILSVIHFIEKHGPVGTALAQMDAKLGGMRAVCAKIKAGEVSGLYFY